MKPTIHCFVPFADEAQVKATVEALKQSDLVTKITLLATEATEAPVLGCDGIVTESLNASSTMKKIS